MAFPALPGVTRKRGTARARQCFPFPTHRGGNGEHGGDRVMTDRENPAASYLDRMTDKRIPGGCDDCDAHQTVEKQDDGLYVLTVNHDETCPTLKARRR